MPRETWGILGLPGIEFGIINHCGTCSPCSYMASRPKYGDNLDQRVYVMKPRFSKTEFNITPILSFSVPLVLFWVVLLSKIPYFFSQSIHEYSLVIFLIVLGSYYLCFKLHDPYGIFASFSLSMVLFALALSFKWTSGFSDNGMIGGLLPYKDGKNYYYGANLILNGLPVIRAGQSTERPLFPGFLSALLLLTDQNLKIALAIIVQLAGIGLYLSARQIRASTGVLSASLFSTFMYFYIQGLTGYVLSESLGFTLGCFAFILIYRAAHNLKWFDLTLGLITLLVAVSARAGAFFIFPILILWVGWIFRGEQRFSIKAAASSFVIILVGYFLINTIYARLLGIPPGFAFGNFSYALYGQVRGGTGWHSAIEELGTRQPSVVYSAALKFFLEHPASLFIGFAKSYRDFFLPVNTSIFPFKVYGWQDWPNFVMWMGTMLSILRGLILSLKHIRLNITSLMVAGFVGIIFSIPFLPPIDGGARFYASTMAFFFVLPAVGVAQLSKGLEEILTSNNDLQSERFVSRSVSIILLALTLIVPIGIYSFSQKPTSTVSSCPSRQEPFAMEMHQGSYIDLVKEGTAKCGFAPEVCFRDFEANNTELAIDDYYQKVILLTENNDGNVRIIPAINLVNEKFHYFYFSHSKIPNNSMVNLVTGCAIEITTRNQSIYYVESAVISEK